MDNLTRSTAWAVYAEVRCILQVWDFDITSLKLRGIVEMHVDFQTPDFDIWITVNSPRVITVRRHSRTKYLREKFIFKLDREELYNGDLHNLLIQLINGATP